MEKNTGKEAAALKRELASGTHKVKKLNDEIEILKEQRDGVMVKLNNMRYELQYRNEELNKMTTKENFLKDDTAYNAKRLKYEDDEKQIDLADKIRILLLEEINPSDNQQKDNHNPPEHFEEPKQKTACHTVKIRYIATIYDDEEEE